MFLPNKTNNYKHINAQAFLINLSVEFPNYTFCSPVPDLGIILDQTLTFASHLNRLSRDCFYQLRHLRTVARSLSPGAAATLVHSFITIRLDYCRSLYSGLPSVRLASLSLVLCSAARLIGQIPKFGHAQAVAYLEIVQGGGHVKGV